MARASRDGERDGRTDSKSPRGAELRSPRGTYGADGDGSLGSQREREQEVETILKDVASKNKDALDSAKIVPLSPDWEFCTNGLYLLLATAGCGKSRFIIKHILMADRLSGGRYYSLIAYCSTSGEMDNTVQTYMESNVIKTPLCQVSDDKLMDFLARHLKRKRKYYAMVKYLRRALITKTLQHSIDKHNFKVWVYDKASKKAFAEGLWDPRDPIARQVVPSYSGSGMGPNSEVTAFLKEKVNKKKLMAWILKKMAGYGVRRYVLPLLVVLDDFAGHKLIERKETPLAKMMTKCRHYSCTFIIAVQTPKYVIKNIRRQATDVVVWLGLNQEDFFELFKEIAYSYDVKRLWEEYRRLKTQTSHLILNIKAHTYRFIEVDAT
jgi:hypothetical protein